MQMMLKPAQCCLAAMLFSLALFGLIGPANAELTAEQKALVHEAEQARIDAINKVIGSVVAIYGNDRQGGGSGVIFDPRGYALTNFHVVRAAGKNGKAGLADGKLYDWELVGIDPGGDIAMIKLKGKKAFPYSKFGNSDYVRIGDWVMAMGNPFTLTEDEKPTVTLGIVSGVNRYQPGTGPNGNLLEYGNCIQFDSSINPGNSGGPLFNMLGEVVGINGRGSFEERGRVNVGVGYAISMEQVKNFIPDLMATRTTFHGTLEAVFKDTTEGIVICQSVNLDAPIGEAGLKPGDVLVSFAGQKIKSANQYKNVISTFPANWPVTVVWRRGDKVHQATVRLTEWPYKPRPVKTTREAPKQQPNDGKKQLIQQQDKVNAEEGAIRDPKMAQKHGKMIMQDFVNWRGKASNLSLREHLFIDRQKTGSIAIAISPDNKVIRIAEDESSTLKNFKAVDDALASAWQTYAHDIKSYKSIQLLGGDLADGKRCFRVLVEDQAGQRFILWMSLLAEDGCQLEQRLVKVMPYEEGDNLAVGAMDDKAAAIFSDYREVKGIMVPHLRKIVRGIDEAEVARYEIGDVNVNSKVEENAKAEEVQP